MLYKKYNVKKYNKNIKHWMILLFESNDSPSRSTLVYAIITLIPIIYDVHYPLLLLQLSTLDISSRY